jgi:hypothetical protein
MARAMSGLGWTLAEAAGIAAGVYWTVSLVSSAVVWLTHRFARRRRGGLR